MFGIQPIFWVLIDSAVAFLYLFIISKILGKKQIAQLEFIDYTVGISLGSIAAEMATNTEVPFYFFLIAMTIFFALALLVAIIGRKNTFLKRLLKGKPATLVYDGKINYKELKKNKIDVNDLLSMLREKNYFDIADVAYAVFEPSGELSVLPVGAQKPVVMEDVDKSKVEKAELTDVLIVDGAVSYSGLSEINKDVDWLFSRLKIKQKKDLQNIILAVYDDKQDKFNVHYKNQ
ncbi:DUF421 domain-containing protein [Anaerocaecibacter muris]|uniref:DUF421 domain-containing protein n=1 Tax=Anaerocaecibacter muris TaxID=2941513 RepID=UPI00203CCDF7|nr:DUF421 domain-containing protein [Anaerocaecibacter muris]